MFDKLQVLLDKWVTSERSDPIMAALETMQEYGYVSAWSEISTYIEDTANDSAMVVLDTIEQIIQVGLTQLLLAHSISSKASISFKTLTLQALKLLEVTEEHLEVLRILDACEEPSEQLVYLLELVTTQPWVDFVDDILSVSPHLLERIRQLHLSAVEDAVSMEEISMADPDRYRKVNVYFNAHENLMGYAAITESGRHIGVPINYLLDDFKMGLMLLQPTAPDVAAMEIVGIALVSDIPLASFGKETKKLLDLIYSDINFISRVDAVIDTYIAEVIRG